MGTPDHFTGTQLYGVFNGALVPVAVDTDGQLFALLKGWDGTTYVPLRLDTDGRIEAIIKGDYEGTLSSVAIDDQGRLLIVPTDPENVWGVPTEMGLANLAGRLGSLATYDYRGNVVFLTDFSEGLGQFTFTGLGTGNDHYLEVDRVEFGGYGLYLVGGSTSSRTKQATRLSPVPPTGRIGFELGIDVVSDVGLVDLYVRRYDGTTRWDGYIRLDVVNSKIQVYDKSTGFNDVATGIEYNETILFFNAVKLVIETTSALYTRLLFNSVEYDLSAWTQFDTTSSTNPQIESYVTIISTTGNNGKIVLGHWLETRGESENA